MRKQLDDATTWLKNLKHVRGCITGSSLLGEYWDGMDVDLFVYDEQSLNKVLFELNANDKFHILDLTEQWKYDQQINEPVENKKNYIQTIKFIYNTCIPVNIILKKSSYNIFNVLSSFDMDIIAIGYDLQTKQYLDLGNDVNRKNKIASWNTWNNAYYKPNIWETSRILRQISRIFKYHKRGYNTDKVIFKYIDLIDEIQKMHNLFENSITYTSKLKITQTNTRIVKDICNLWLKTHTISDKELELLNNKIREL